MAITALPLFESFKATSGNTFASAGSGYLDTAGWSGILGAGSVLDADSRDILDSVGAVTDILKVQKVSANFNSVAHFDFDPNTGLEHVITYTQCWIYPSAEGLANGKYHYLLRGSNTSNSWTWFVSLYQSAAKLYFRFYIWNNGGPVTTDSAQISLGAWYKHEVKYDHTNHAYEWRMNNVQLTSGTLTGTHNNGIRIIECGDNTASLTLTAYFDRLSMQATGYYEERPKVIMVM